MFDKKITSKDKAEIGAVIEFMAETIVTDKIDKLIKGIDFNGNISGEILDFLLDKSGFKFYQETGVLTPEDLKSLGEHKEFAVNGIKFLIAKKSKMESKVKTKKVKKGKKVNKNK